MNIMIFNEQNMTMNMKNVQENEVMQMWNKLALILLIIGGINWGLIGIFSFDLVAWIFGGQGAVLSRIIYTIVAISAIWCITFLFRREDNLVEVTD